ncbi:MAG: iron complex transport system permease protein [Paraglaciecola sp.]|jgi:iron complex transport system permease protein
MKIVKHLLEIPSLGILLILSILLSLLIGAFSVSVSEIWAAFFQNGQDTTKFLILNIRLPRILLAGLIGAGLAISGAAIQGLFRNPLADQTLIGVSSGAMLFAVLSIVFMGSFLATFTAFFQQATIAIAAFLGGLLTTYLVYSLSKESGKTSVMTMLLAGIAISAFAAAITGVFIYLSDDQQLRDITFWSMGSLGGASWVQVLITLPVVVFGSWQLIRYAKPLNAILLGEKEASYLGIDIEKIKARTILITALIVGVCISMSGLIGFVGLIVPHFLRLLKGTDYRYLLKSSALVGAFFLVFTDTLARTIIAPAELPIGILTALVGAPFFLWLLLQNKQKNYSV